MIPETQIGGEPTILVSGTVDGAGNTGIAATTGPAAYYYFDPNVGITVAQGGIVTGSTAITAGLMSGTNSGYALVELDNSGTITGTAGVALATGDNGAFYSIINRTGGTIGGISGAVGTIQNHGTIDGGSGSAIAGGTYSTLVYTSSLTNSGSVVSSGSGATVSDYSGAITNSGTISNSGTGSAITGDYGPITNNAGGLITASAGDTISLTGFLSIDNAGTLQNTGSGRAIVVGSGGITNRAGGTISASGTVIEGTAGVSLTNYGSIVGNIVAGSVLGNSNSSIDSTAGTINGNVTLGAGNDTLFATYSDAGGLITGIAGQIDGGAGMDTIQAKFAADATLSKAIALPTNFEAFGIQMDSGVTVTLSDGFSAPGTLQFTDGTLVNSAQLSGSGTVVRSSSSTAFRNEGNVTGSAVPDRYTVDISGGTFTNSGTITSQGDAVSTFVYHFTNSGTITAAETAVNAHYPGDFNNSGTIRSTGGIGLGLSGSVYSLDYAAINSGTIEGAQAGVSLSTSLINTGSITSDNTGVALGWYGLLYNKAGGVVSGGTMAIGGSLPWLYDSTVINEGTINGDVSIASNSPYYPGYNTYYALAGGVLNGSLTLGLGDTLVTDIQNSGTGQFAGINGTVTASLSNLRYMVSQDATATAGSIAGFSNIGYDLYNGATLTLSGSDVQTGTMTFAGYGNAVLDVDFNVVAQSALQRVSLLTPLATSSSGDDVSITSKGAITLSRVAPYTYYGAAVSLSSTDTFTNEGTITVTDTSGQTGYPLSAISGGTVVNSGTITATGGNGVNYAQSLTNSGTITASGVAAIDIQGTIANSGTLTSTGDAAIATSSYYPSIIVDNQAGGTISGNGTAIRLSGGTVINAGTIQGTVDLGYSRSYSTGLYEAAGGTLTGDLLFGSGNDVLVETGSGYGVTGSIDGGDGFDVVGHRLTQSGTVSLGTAELPLNFEGEFTAASGADTVVTIMADAPLIANIYVAGDGQIINRAATSGSVRNTSNAGIYVPDLSTVRLASFTNEAEIGSGIALIVDSLANSGAVGSANLYGSAILQTAVGSLSFDNSGEITAANSDYWARTVDITGNDLATAAINNSGTISGFGLNARLYFSDQASPAKGSLTNSGTISGDYGVAVTSLATSENAPPPLSFDFTNSGTIESTAASGSALSSVAQGVATVSVTNSGTIRASGDGSVEYFPSSSPCSYDFWSCYELLPYTTPTIAVSSSIDSQFPGSSVATTITNEAAGVIETTGAISTAIRTYGPLTLVNAGTITGAGGYTVDASDISAGIFGTTRFAGAIQTFGTGEDSITNSGTINGSIELDAGNDSIVNTGTINGDVFLGAGDDRFVELLSATLTGTVDGGDGSDTLVIDLTGSGTLNAAYYNAFTNFETFGLTGTGSIAVNGVLPVQTLMLEAGSTFELKAGSTLQTLGSTVLTGTDGSEHVINRGTIIGDLALGGGDDVFEAYAGSSVAGTINAGAGTDRLAFHLDESAGHTPIDLQPYTGFEQFALESGIGTLSGQASFDTIWVNGGRLIGLAGSTISAPGGVTVASGATFGSAGTVNGNIVVDGTLSPGASPATMTVNGNVVLATGSTTLFEMTPTVSDALVINGSLTIASGTTLNIVGERPLTPGVTYHLITTTDGITGSFSTIDKVSTVQGFVIQTADRLDLLGTLQLHAGASSPVTATTAYLNSLLIDGVASDQLVNALPKLTGVDGYVNVAAMATLHPEAYATASQIGIDNGLTISSALRSTQRASEGRRPGFFALGQGLGSWQDLRGNAAAGTASARQNSGGFLGGVGYQTGKLAVSVVLGRIYAHQALPTLGASTKANGTFVGATASFARGALDLGGSVTWDDSSATTHRALFDNSTVTGHYSVRTLAFDAHGGYAFSLSKGGWRIGPELGLTHIRVKRGESIETGDSLFALDVASREQDATFLSADVRFDMAPSAQMRPWLTAGWRHRLDGDVALATAGLPGVAEQFTVAGAQRDRDYAQIGGGFDWAVTPGVTLFARGSSAFTSSNGATNITGGIRLGL
ncbi:hypothetical protein [Novosphingobium beihaiensis]|uniref:Autotransporter domain-containing protein n=1 Tax=Novosphingobium beihaiensis TaxID=2930389 RepID=A0ABT0BVI3_9SPHN|nr:hypothetical protein [Novosphingobium beihaiensis]MCJ2189047.1 hypothetical protein [Novosphingobium beihaiensis]